MSDHTLKTVKVYAGSDLKHYAFGNGHPFGPDRHDAFFNRAVELGLDKRVEIMRPEICGKADLERFHDRDYIEHLTTSSIHGFGFLDAGDTPAFPGIYEAVSFVVGSSLAAMHQMINGHARRVFIPIAGLHHASRSSAGGFCAASDIGVVIETLREIYAIKRILYVDIDAHHGDGVFYSYETDPDVVIADIHEDGNYLYPGTGHVYESGKGKARGSKLNIPVMPGSADAVFYRSWDALEEFVSTCRPEFIILQAGADCIKGDPITHLEFTPKIHRHATARLCALADKHCNGRILAMGGGGYNRSNLAQAWCEVVQAMIDTP